MRHGDLLASLQESQKKSRLKSRQLGEWRRLYLTTHPYKWLILWTHRAPQYMSDMTYCKYQPRAGSGRFQKVADSRNKTFRRPLLEKAAVSYRRLFLTQTCRLVGRDQLLFPNIIAPIPYSQTLFSFHNRTRNRCSFLNRMRRNYRQSVGRQRRWGARDEVVAP